MTAPSPHTHPAERETPAGEAMREAVAYLTPHPSTKGPVILDPAKMRAAQAERDEARARADKAEREARDLHQQNEKLTSGCPWEGPASEAAKYRPSDPCPICGDTGEVSNDQPLRCVAYASGRQNYALAAAEAALTTLRADHAAEVARLTEALAPFAAEAERYEPDEGDGHDIIWGDVRLRIGDLRRARAALAPKETTDA